MADEDDLFGVDLEEDEDAYGEEYPGVGGDFTTPLERAEWAPGMNRCDSYWRGGGTGSWICTLREGHPGRHVGGYNQTSCGARWGEDSLAGLDCGPDDGS